MSAVALASCAEEHKPNLAGFDQWTEGDLTDMLNFFDRHEAVLPYASGLEALDRPSSSSGSDAQAVTRAQSAVSSPTRHEASPTVATVATYVSAQQAQMHTGNLVQRAISGNTALVAVNGQFYAMPQPQQYAHFEGFDSNVQQSAPCGRDSKTTISHSTIEKQRRDRINSLIDELRELVPSSAAMKGPDGSDMKRPKHVVLSDTITLLRHLKERVRQDEMELQHLKVLHQQLASNGHLVAPSPAAASGMATGGSAAAAGSNAAAVAIAAATAADAPRSAAAAAAATTGSAQNLLHRNLSGPAPGAASSTANMVAAATGSPAACPELPQAPSNLPASVGVLVEEGPGCFLVKVNCKDRRGLLSDITSAIRGLPLQITRAAITTSDGGSVYDVFEIVVEPGVDMEGVTALDVQFQVHQALYKWRLGSSGSSGDSQEQKRRRSDE